MKKIILILLSLAPFLLVACSTALAPQILEAPKSREVIGEAHLIYNDVEQPFILIDAEGAADDATVAPTNDTQVTSEPTDTDLTETVEPTPDTTPSPGPTTTAQASPTRLPIRVYRACSYSGPEIPKHDCLVGYKMSIGVPITIQTESGVYIVFTPETVKGGHPPELWGKTRRIDHP